MYAAYNVQKLDIMQVFAGTSLEVRELKDGNFLGSITLEKVNSVKGAEESEWQAKIKVTIKICSKIIHFRLDTDVDIAVIPD